MKEEVTVECNLAEKSWQTLTKAR